VDFIWNISWFVLHSVLLSSFRFGQSVRHKFKDE